MSAYRVPGRDAARRIFRTLGGLYAGFKAKNGITLAASVSFFAFLSFFPFLVLLASITSFFLERREVLSDLERLMQALPQGLSDTVMNVVGGVMAQWKAATIASFLVLLYSSFAVFAQLQYALNKIMGTKIRPNRWRGTLKLFSFFFIVVFLLVLLVLGGSAMFVVADKLHQILLVRRFIFIELSAFVIETCLFAFSYRYLAARKLRWKNVFLGGLTASVSWEIMKVLFGWYVSSIHGYTAVYGIIGSLFFLMLWLFYSVLIYLVGAHISVEMP